jgi:hypothetical protein
MKTSIRLLLFAGAAGLALGACQIRPTTSTATLPPPAVSPVLTETPIPVTPSPITVITTTPEAPTATLPPKDTAAPTPNPTLTPDPNEGVGDVIYEDRFDGSGYLWTYQEEGVVNFTTADGQLNAVMSKGNVGPRTSVRTDITAGDQQVRVTARAHICYENDEYGLIFRSTDFDQYGNPLAYVFKLSCAGKARVEALVKGQQPIVLMDWTPSAAILAGAPAENTLMVWVAGSEFRFYINDRFLFSATDKTYTQGFYGFYLRSRTEGGGLSVSFDDLVAKAVTRP